MDKKTIIFLHGKQSTPEGSGSGQAIRAHFSKNHQVLIPDYLPMERTHSQIEGFLTDFISAYPGALIVGISLGGYWAYRMCSVLPEQLGLSCIILNPYFYNYPEIDIPSPKASMSITLVVNLDDDLIWPEEVISRFQGKAKIVTFEKGGHRFVDKTPIIKEIEAVISLIPN